MAHSKHRLLEVWVHRVRCLESSEQSNFLLQFQLFPGPHVEIVATCHPEHGLKVGVRQVPLQTRKQELVYTKFVRTS